MASIHEIKKDKKSRDTAPLSYILGHTPLARWREKVTQMPSSVSVDLIISLYS